MDEFFKKPHRREIREIPIAPILDMLVAVIFFLLLSTSFEEFSRQTLPPATIGAAEPNPAAPPPLAPKLVVRRTPAGAETVVMSWDGEKPGSYQAAFDPRSEPATELVGRARDLVARFALEHPGETSLKLGFSESIAYQDVIAVMDGARASIKDVVLISYASASERAPVAAR